jgi:tetratricopeptide (TPR) repeat protein
MVAAVAAWKLMASGRAGRAVLAVVAVYWAVQYARVYPDSLGYFNSLVGGPRYGAEYLADSNLDWGQDLKPLKRWMDDHGVAHVNLAYFGTSDPKYYGIDFTRLPISTLDESQYERPQLPGYVAISVTEEIGVYQPRRWRLFYQGFRGLTPSATIGSSIKVYWLDRWPVATPDDVDGTPSASDLDGLKSLAGTLSRLRWFNQAARHYRRYLEFRPDDAGARLALSAAFLQAGRYSEAEAAARDMIADAPDNAAAFDLLGRALASSGRIDGAIEAFERALDIDPEMSAAGDALAIVRRARPAPPPPPPPAADRRDRWRLLI